MRLAARPAYRRIALIDNRIRAGDYPNAVSLARELEVHPRTIHRDLEFLIDSLRAPVEFCRDHNGYRYADATFALPAVCLNEQELVALFLCERLLQQYRGTPYAGHLANLFQKLTAGLSDQITIDLAHLADVFSVRSPAAAAGDAGQFAQLTRAAREGRRLDMLYWTASRDKTCSRLVDPYHLASLDGDWYLIAYCHLREAVLMFSTARIRSLRETGERFDRPADFRITEYLDSGFRKVRGTGPPQQVRLLFAPEAARYVREKVWHPTQAMQDLPDGRLELTMQVNHLLEVRRWVLSYGAGCEVLEPHDLREEIKDELREVLMLYQQ